MLRRENLRPFLKPSTGIGRGHRMSPSDKRKFKAYQSDIKDTNRTDIPRFITTETTRQEIRAAIVAQVNASDKPVKVRGVSFTKENIKSKSAALNDVVWRIKGSIDFRNGRAQAMENIRAKYRK